MKKFRARKVDGDSEYTVWAENVVEAAERFVEEYERSHAEFPVGAGNEDMMVEVVTPDNNHYRFNVTGEPRPVYSAEPIEY